MGVQSFCGSGKNIRIVVGRTYKRKVWTKNNLLTPFKFKKEFFGEEENEKLKEKLNITI